MRGVSYTSHADSFYLGSFSYTSRAGFHFYQLRFSHTSHAGFIFIWGVFLTHPMLTVFLCGEFLLHNPCWLPFYLRVSLTYPTMTPILPGEFLLRIRTAFTFYRGSFSDRFPAGFIFIWGVSLTHPSLASFYAGSFSYTLFLCGEFLLYNPCWLPFLSGTFSYTSHDDVNFTWGVSLTHPVLASFLSGEFLLHIPCWL